jgi:peroxiredoxin
MNRNFWLVCTLLVIISLLVQPLAWGFRNLKEGEKSPDFNLKDLDGKTHSLSQYKRKVVIVLYWRKGQERSLNALKALNSLQDTLSDQPVQILAITKDTDRSTIKDLRKSLGLTFPILLDSKEEVYSQFGVFVFPSTALIDRKGMYRFHYGGFREDYEKEIAGQARVILGLISENELRVEAGGEAPLATEEQKRARNHINLGRTLRKRGMDEKAVEEIQKAVALDPSNPEGHILLGFFLLDQGELDQAIEHLSTGMELDPKSTDAKIGLGRAYRMKGQTDKALDILGTELNLFPDSAAIHLELGEAYESLGRTKEACEHYKASAHYALDKQARY